MQKKKRKINLERKKERKLQRQRAKSSSATTPATVSAARENTEWECGQPLQTTVNRNVKILMEKKIHFKVEKKYSPCANAEYI